ncbi:MAG: 4-hydroxythreonine-4-phosphate dehydrogenase, partial [Aquificae bacterium]|nr:4-hydroxythreonine-4-phosphate dehydrogenase [Aquificota bacterium]
MRYGITLGDPTGISAEVLLKGAEKLPEGTYIIYGSLQPILSAQRKTGKKLPLKTIKEPEEAKEKGFYLIEVVEGSFSEGKPDKKSGEASVKYLEKAVDHALEGRINSLTTLPISKEQII